MGLYQALTHFYDRSEGLPYPGFCEARHVWVVRLDKDGSPCSGTNPMKNDDFRHFIPKAPSDRTGGAISAQLLLDKASYALGLSKATDDSDKATNENLAFCKLLKICLEDTKHRPNYRSELGGSPSEQTISILKAVIRFQEIHREEFIKGLPSALKDNGMVVFLVDSFQYAFDDKWLVEWLSTFHSLRLSEGVSETYCVVCGTLCKAPRLSPKVSLFGSVTPISDFNMKSASSAEYQQMSNSPICGACGGKAQSALEYLIRRDPVTGADEKTRKSKAGPHAVVLAEDLKKGGGERPLSNQVAIFWTKDHVIMPASDGDEKRWEGTLSLALNLEAVGDVTANSLTPEARPGQLRRFLESPWFCRGSEVAVYNTTAFYFAILSPNTGRLVLREWIETDLHGVRSFGRSFGNAGSAAGSDRIACPP
jgi:hypothetical protein